MKHLQNSAKTILVFDDEKTYGCANEAEQYPTAPVETVADEKIAHPLTLNSLGGLLNSALSLISTRNEMLGDETDAYDDHLIPLTDEEDYDDGSNFATAISFLNSIADSLNGEKDEVKPPLFLSAFKSRFLG
ncbi:MAG: hypothetical protein SFW65_00650 [Alphaproteobacteria bacterium]|nr:hypothetical protein [Alphaproteobacteria bacterium]